MKTNKWLMLIVLALVSCTPRYDMESRCIPPVVQNSYFPYNEKEADTYSIPSQPIPPWWERQLVISKDGYNKTFRNADIVIRNGNELWSSANEAVALYKIDTKELHIYPFSEDRGYSFVVSDLLVGKDETLWAYLDVEPTSRNSDSPKDLAVLARFNPKLDRFEFVYDNNDIVRQEYLGYPDLIRLKWRHLLRETHDGKLMLVVNGKLTLFDPETGDAVRLAESVSTITSFDLDANDNVWFSLDEDRVLRKYDMEGAQITEYGTGPDRIYGGDDDAITVDRSGLVWVANNGWLDPDNPKGVRNYLWTEIVPSTVYIKKPGPDALYQWTGADDSIQVSDGSMWFIGGVGIVHFSKETGEWCWKSPRSVPIVEDDEGNLWMAYGLQIYKYQLP